VLDGLMQSIKLEEPARKLQVLRAIDKLDRLGLPGVRELLGHGRRDESGDVTKGANLSPAQIDTVMGYVMSVAVDWRQHVNLEAVGSTDYYTHEKVLSEWANYVGSSDIGRQAIDELRAIADLLSAANYQTRVKFASDVVRGLEYYTGPVFE